MLVGVGQARQSFKQENEDQVLTTQIKTAVTTIGLNFKAILKG